MTENGRQKGTLAEVVYKELQVVVYGNRFAYLYRVKPPLVAYAGEASSTSRA